MGTTTSLTVGVDLRTQSAVYASNTILQIGFRVEAGRISGGHYMSDRADEIEKAIKIWLREQMLNRVVLELYSPQADTAYETCTLNLVYSADPTEQAIRPPIAQLEELMHKLTTLPADAAFRFLVECAPGATKVSGWEPTDYKPLAGGVKEEHTVGEEHGYGHIHSSIKYVVSNWDQLRGNG